MGRAAVETQVETANARDLMGKTELILTEPAKIRLACPHLRCSAGECGRHTVHLRDTTGNGDSFAPAGCLCRAGQRRHALTEAPPQQRCRAGSQRQREDA